MLVLCFKYKTKAPVCHIGKLAQITILNDRRSLVRVWYKSSIDFDKILQQFRHWRKQSLLGSLFFLRNISARGHKFWKAIYISTSVSLRVQCINISNACPNAWNKPWKKNHAQLDFPACPQKSASPRCLHRLYLSFPSKLNRDVQWHEIYSAMITNSSGRLSENNRST